MGTYKVIQDIEAEDTIIGWMTPRQAIYAAIVIVSGFIGFMLFNAGAWWLAIFLLPHMILFTVLAGPFVHDQPSEVWLLAKIKFFLQPRRRIWDQSGVKDLVTITVPKRVERHLTDGLSQTEVKSRLQALANTIDSRGWAIKNVSPTMYNQNFATAGVAPDTDRLVDSSYLPQEVPDYDVYATDDILDERNNPTAVQMRQLVDQSTQTHRQQIVDQMRQPQQVPTATNWFVDDPAAVPATKQAMKKIPQTNPTDFKESTKHMRTISTELPRDKPVQAAPQHVKPVNEKINQYVYNDDLNVATIGRQLNKPDEDNEVVVSLR